MAGDAVPALTELGLGGAQGVVDLMGGGEERLTRWREADRATRAVEQRHAGGALELVQLLRHGGRCEVQCRRGALHTVVKGHGPEGEQSARVEVHS
jgi:hypothetical protein